MEKSTIEMHEFIIIMESLKVMRTFSEKALDEAHYAKDIELIAKGKEFLADHAKLFLKLCNVLSDGAGLIPNLEGFAIIPVCKVDIEEVEHDGIEQ